MNASGCSQNTQCPVWLEGERVNDVTRHPRLFSLAHDAACSGFDGRNLFYEQFFAGDPWRLASLAAARYPLQDDLKQRPWQFLQRTRDWDARWSGPGAP